MPNRQCAHGICKTHTRNKEDQLKFFPFPRPSTDSLACRAWIKACGRPASQLDLERIIRDYENADAKKAKGGVNAYLQLWVCSMHFIDGQPSEQYLDLDLDLDLVGNLQVPYGATRK